MGIKTTMASYLAESRSNEKINESSSDISLSEIRIYVTDFASYNNNEESGEWFTFSDFSDADELSEAIKNHFEDLDKKNPLDSPREEIMVTAQEGLPSVYYEESMDEDHFEKIYSLIEYAEDNDLDNFANEGDNLRDIWNDYCDNISSDDHIHKLTSTDDLLNHLPSDTMEVFSMGTRSNINWQDDYFTHDGDGNLVSLSDPSTEISESDLFTYLIDNL